MPALIFLRQGGHFFSTKEKVGIFPFRGGNVGIISIGFGSGGEVKYA